MGKVNKDKAPKENAKSGKDKVDMSYNLEIERKNAEDLEDSGYDFVPRSNHWLSSDEQKIKTREIEEKTKE